MNKDNDDTSKALAEVEKLKDREIVFNDFAVAQLTNNNQLLLTLGVGFLAFTFEGSGIRNLHIDFSSHVDWPSVFYVSYLILTTFSIMLGIFVLYTRHSDFRITYHIIKTRRKILKKYGEKLPFQRYDDITAADRIVALAKVIFAETRLIKHNDLKTFKSDEKSFLSKFNQLRRFTATLGSASVRWTKLQGFVLLLGIIFFVLSLL